MPKFLPLVAGLLLLAPAAHATLNISTEPTQNVTCAARACTATATQAVLNVDELEAMLATSNTVVRTGGGAVTIRVLAPLTWASDKLLSLHAEHDITVSAPVTVEHEHGRVRLDTDTGDLKFFPGGSISFQFAIAKLSINHRRYRLVQNLADLAAAYRDNHASLVALANDYDAGQDGTYAQAPVTETAGTFEGLGHTIANLHIDSPNTYVGLFGGVEGEAVLRDVTLKDADIVANGRGQVNAGGLAAGGATVIGVHVSGQVQVLGQVKGANQLYAGGIAGAGGSYLRSDSSATVSCSGSCYAGGIAGFGISFVQSHASGNVTAGAHSHAGGLTGAIFDGPITLSYATGDVFVDNTRARADAGGLAGFAFNHVVISDSYAHGTVKSATKGTLGGLIGLGEDFAVNTSYSIGLVQQDATEAGSRAVGNRVGGFVGYSKLSKGYSGDYWDLDTSGQAEACGKVGIGTPCTPAIVGLSDAALKAALPPGFDPAVWGQKPAINNGYPYLLDNPPE